ncbi:inner membrane protein YhjD [Streptomyces sp. SPB162]|nr:inner membrane protein YhjD [Streptomyces sp. SPB162]
MEWLTKLPWIGPWIARLMRTHAWRSFEHLQKVHWSRLAAAVTFTSFLALFPLITVAAAIGAALLSDRQLQDIQKKVSEQVPGIADQLNIDGLVANAGTVGLIAGALLLFTGFGWVASLRDCLRAVWEKDDEDENPFKSRLRDAGILLGLGAAAIVSLASSAFATAAVGWAADHLGVEDSTVGQFFLTAAGFCIAVVADFVLLVVLLTLLPGVEPPRHRVVVAGASSGPSASRSSSWSSAATCRTWPPRACTAPSASPSRCCSGSTSWPNCSSSAPPGPQSLPKPRRRKPSSRQPTRPPPRTTRQPSAPPDPQQKVRGPQV